MLASRSPGISRPSLSLPPRLVALLLAVVLAVAAAGVSAFMAPARVAVLAGVMILALLAWIALPKFGGFLVVVAFGILTGLYTELSEPAYAPPISFGGISLHYLDLLLIATACVAIVARRFFHSPRTVEVLLVAFVVWTASVGVVRSLYLDLRFDTWVRELRTIAYFAFPILLLPLLNSRERLKSATYVLLWTSVGVAIMALFVRVFHDYIPSQTNLLIYRDEYGVRVFQVFGVERATWAFVFAGGLYLATTRRWLWLIIAANAVTLVVALTRGSYIAVAVAGALMLVALGRERVSRHLLAGTAAAVLVLGAAASLSWVSGEDVLTPFIGRVATVDQLASGEGTVGVRLTEARVVLSFLNERPDSLLLGEGLGGFYTDPYNELTAEIVNLGDRRYSYVHNGFLWYVLRGGLPATLLLYAFCVTLCVQCARRAQHVEDRWLKGTLVGVAGVFVAVLTLSASGAPLSEGLRMSVLMLHAAIGMGALRVTER